ncbi:hypothetical protein FHS02_005344 [Massilia umbonata]|uniref:Protein CopB n=1 Tax=Pseudoduganella umbonata TaxID=864828 RepID=A0A7W5EFV2_9BURK|nr:hypothetical protein [Pseudoduganella umbonata]
MPKNSSAMQNGSVGRAHQISQAQNHYRERLKDAGYQRLQEWLPEATSERLKYLCDATGLSKREALVRLIDTADLGKIKSVGSKHDDR